MTGEPDRSRGIPRRRRSIAMPLLFAVLTLSFVGIAVYAATSPQPMRTVPPEPEEDDRDWSLGRPADMDEYTDHPSPAGSRRN